MFRFIICFTPVILIFLCFSGILASPREDPLIEQIVVASTQQSISEEELIQKMLAVDVLYFGEKHDNKRHHEIQKNLLESLIAQGKKPILGFEFFYQHQSSDLIQFIEAMPSPFHKKQASPEKAEKQLRQQLGWQNRSDEDWHYYFSLIKLAKQHRLSVFGADLPKGLVTRISRGGVETLNPVESRLLNPTGFENENYRQLMYEKFKDSHCGWSSPELSRKLYQSWIARNDAMAQALAAMITPETGPVVLVVGGGHIGHNMGVYERVEHLHPGVKQLNFGMIEIFMEPAPLADYLERPQVEEITYLPMHEIYWFTQRADYEDPCKKFNMK
ncbi:MAG: ChaN family lipoprotein [SAR324 cluster bacterium]|nr:ChaN family lipoprotein [SAR324 cluster bacterium]